MHNLIYCVGRFSLSILLSGIQKTEELAVYGYHNTLQNNNRQQATNPNNILVKVAT
jgi:hypothetical protein